MRTLFKLALAAFAALHLPLALAAAPVTDGTCKIVRNPNFFKDEGLAIKVATRLQFNKPLLREKIDVKNNSGVISLSGSVSAGSLATLAGKVAAEVDGVDCVNNFLKVGPPEPPTPGTR